MILLLLLKSEKWDDIWCELIAIGYLISIGLGIGKIRVLSVRKGTEQRDVVSESSISIIIL